MLLSAFVDALGFLDEWLSTRFKITLKIMGVDYHHLDKCTRAAYGESMSSWTEN